VGTRIGKLKRQARHTLISGAVVSPARIAGVVLAYLGITFLLSALMTSLSGFDRYYTAMAQAITDGRELSSVAYPAVEPIAAILAVALTICISVMSVGFSSYGLRLSRGEKTGVRALADGFNALGKVVIINLVRTVTTYGGLVLFVVPGIYFSLRYSMAVYVMLDNPELSAFGCLRESARLMKGRKMEFLLLDLSFIGWYLLSQAAAVLFAVPILNIWVTPYTEVAFAGFYNGLTAAAPPDTEGMWAPL
jgi:hypothetical protein